MAEVKSDEFAGWASEIILGTLDPSVTMEGRFVQAPAEIDVGEDVAVLQGTFDVSEDGQEMRVAVMVFQIRTGQVITSTSFIAANAPGDQELLVILLGLISDRQASLA